jgi:hypothetical protein
MLIVTKVEVSRGRDWLARQPVPDDERFAIERHVRELDRLAEDLTILDREIAESTLDDASIRRLLTITGVNPIPLKAPSLPCATAPSDRREAVTVSQRR